ncbi:diacylglycerol kinase family protein [Desulfitobacterium chlororespirans]|uniref:Diacylglycerol kinase (ATP) n=1 Tax=Desulfitobacterium chlororespirans DSM 11544 TaxID=1121395 RepID=A0A1M7USZ6_9FIRM|nr:diacylglycerol kinase family protein [Desulfitobacterium chlororespirans]SHN86055.1 diacylglycerol kinase (ATP) [Desulfitobacterium chlororespirans DSM 11544]
MGQHHKKPSNWESFGDAFQGILYNCKTQRHFRFHVFTAALVLLIAVWLRLERWEWVVLLLTIGSVMAAEAFNTAVEIAVDLAEPDFNPQAGLAKDVAAGAVLITAIIAVAVGVVIFGPRLAGLLGLG